MKRVGIFLAYSPEQSIRKEGLGRLLAFFIQGAIDRQDFSISVACPGWYRRELYELLNDHEIDTRKVEIITTKADSYVWRLREWSRKRVGSPKRGRRGLRSTAKLLRHRAWRFAIRAAVSNTASQAIKNAIFSSFYILSLILVSFVILPFAIVRCLIRGAPAQLRGPLAGMWRLLSTPLSTAGRAHWTRDVYEELRAQELDRLITTINARTDISGWLIPTLFWPEVTGIEARTVVVAPDIVFFEQPVNFGDDYSEKVLERVEKIAEKADHFITYSEYVKDAHLVHGLGVHEDRISVIRHGRVSLAQYLTLGMSADPETRREVAVHLVDVYQRSARQSNAPWTRVDFCHSPFVFYSSQLRHHKNILNLIKSVEQINRVDGVNVRLLLTADIYSDGAISKYIRERGLENIIFSVHDIPSRLLAAFACLAKIAVTPTLFEGGFPFTFCEAYSVGTPSILSDIPVIREVVKDMSVEMQKHSIFDPGNLASLRNKILWGLQNSEKLFDLQAELYSAYPTWREVAGEYLSLVAETSAEISES